MEKIIEELYLTIKTIKDNINFLKPILEENLAQTKIKVTNAKWALKRADEINEIIKSYQATNTLNEEELKKVSESIIERLIESGEAEITNDDRIKLKMSASPISKKNIDKLIREIQSVERRNELIYQNALINLITVYERAFGKIILNYYTKNSERLGQDKTIKLFEIKKMNSISEIIDYLIINEVKNLMHKGVKEWHEFIKKKFSAKLNYYYTNRRKIEEIFERRNLYAHNDGIINEIYYHKNKDNKEVEIGNKIKTTKKYIFESANTLLSDYIDIVLSFIDYSNKDLIETLFSIAFEEMNEENYLLAYDIFDFLDKNYNDIEENKCLYKINKWICCKSHPELVEFLDEINQYEYEDQPYELQLGIESIKMNKERIRFLVENVSISYICEEEIATWPVFKWVREDSEFYNEIQNICKEKMIFEKKAFIPISNQQSDDEISE